MKISEIKLRRFEAILTSLSSKITVVVFEFKNFPEKYFRKAVTMNPDIKTGIPQNWRHRNNMTCNSDTIPSRNIEEFTYKSSEIGNTPIGNTK